MKIQYASDLHLEFADNWRFLKCQPLKPVGEILILAGDIGYLGDDNYKKHPFWDLVSETYKHVIIIPGNHEFYKFYDLASVQDGILTEIRHNVIVYYNDVVNIGDAEIILSTLWGKIYIQDAFATECGVTDFRRIRYGIESLTYTGFNAEHERCVRFLKDRCMQPTKKSRIIVTHHLPSFQLLSSDFRDSKINGDFVYDEDALIETSGAKYWIYGHSHRNINKQIGCTTCLCNQLGYVMNGEHTSFNPMAYIEV